MIISNFKSFSIFFLSILSLNFQAQTRKVITLKENWKFQKGTIENAQNITFDDAKWQKVSVPHDWAIYGPFDKEIDKQNVAISQNGENIPTEKTGRTGSLPHIGTAWYRNKFNLSEVETSKKIMLLFEGAMSEPEVFINGKKVGEWKYGYSYFYFDISENIIKGKNTIAVKLTNKEFASRWYPGAGLYRNVRLIIKNQESIAQWGTFITTPFVTDSLAKNNIKTSINSNKGFVKTTIFDAEGKALISQESSSVFGHEFEQNIPLENPTLWSPENPYLYTAKTEYFVNNKLSDEITTRFGVRKIEFTREKGFLLNGEITKFKGVCLHHDLGPLGTAINKAALKRQMIILKDMGVNAIRSSHNMPSFEQLELADEMGFLFLAESFDEWKKPKVENGYNRFFDEYAEKDIVNLVRATRNHPSIVM